MSWVSSQPDIQTIALVGSYARGAASETSDIDIMLLVDNPDKYVENADWLQQFGIVEKKEIEDYGLVTSLRIWYHNSYEVEFGITTPDWGKSPQDEGTRRVIEDGMLILFERTNFLSHPE